MSTRVAFRLAWSLWTLNVAVVAALALSSYGPTERPGELASTVAGSLFVLVFATTGAVVASRLPGNPIGWLMCATALSFLLGGVSSELSEHASPLLGLPLETLGAWVSSFVWTIGVGLAATFLLLLFPDGGLPSRRWRPVAWLSGAGLVLVVLGIALAPGRIQDSDVVNPIGIPGASGLLDAVADLGLGLALLGVLASCASLVARYRSSGTEQRQQLKWIAYSVPLVVLWIVAMILLETVVTGGLAVDIANTMTSVALMVLPVAIGIAILRHRLYDIDVVINKTLVYGALTATLGAAYLGSVLLLQLVLSPLTRDSGLAVAGSTLAVAALFRPARARIQAVVDRRFFRRRYDAARTLEAFGMRLRDELDLEALGDDLRGVVSQTMQPAHVSVWLREVPR
ncbi:MAG: hypothetical protein ACRDOY_07610 [Nocardioidaceae bacterium]